MANTGYLLTISNSSFVLHLFWWLLRIIAFLISSQHENQNNDKVSEFDMKPIKANEKCPASRNSMSKITNSHLEKLVSSLNALLLPMTLKQKYPQVSICHPNLLPLPGSQLSTQEYSNHKYPHLATNLSIDE
jgi:hypothetical protein